MQAIRSWSTKPSRRVSTLHRYQTSRTSFTGSRWRVSLRTSGSLRAASGLTSLWTVYTGETRLILGHSKSRRLGTRLLKSHFTTRKTQRSRFQPGANPEINEVRQWIRAKKCPSRWAKWLLESKGRPRRIMKLTLWTLFRSKKRSMKNVEGK